MIRRLGACALAALALASCGRSEQVESAAASEPEPPRAEKERVELPAAEGPKHDVGTFGEQCETGAGSPIEGPAADWSERVISFSLSGDGESVNALPAPTRIRFPRDWDAESSGSDSLEPFSVTTPFSASNSAEVSISFLPAVPVGLAVGGSPWDIRIEVLELAEEVQATEAQPLEGGRCLVIGTDFAGLFAAILSPDREQGTTIAIARFRTFFDDDRTINDVDRETLSLALRVINSVEEIDAPI